MKRESDLVQVGHQGRRGACVLAFRGPNALLVVLLAWYCPDDQTPSMCRSHGAGRGGVFTNFPLAAPATAANTHTASLIHAPGHRAGLRGAHGAGRGGGDTKPLLHQPPPLIHTHHP